MNPGVLHPSAFPDVISVSADAAVEYNHGLRKPSGGLPAAMSWSFTRAMTLANVGLEQLVPETPTNSASLTISKSTPWAETSGYPRPDTLKSPVYVSPRPVRKDETALAW